MGKSALVGHWLETHPDKRAFVWSLYQQAAPEPFLDALADYLGISGSDARGLGRVDVVLAAWALAEPFILVLDGLERVQMPNGGLQDPLLELFLENHPAAARVLATTRWPLKIGVPVEHMALEGLNTLAAAAYLNTRGVRHGAELLALKVGCHPLSLALVGGLVGQYLDGDGQQFISTASNWFIDPRHPEGTMTSHALAMAAAQLPESLAFLVSVLCTFREPVDDATVSKIASFFPQHIQVGDVSESLVRLKMLGLVERTPVGWSAHAAVQEHWQIRLDAQSIHILAADHLWDKVRTHELVPSQVDLAETYLHHLLEGGRLVDALGFYRTRLQPILAVEWGRYEASERMVRRLLEHFPGDASLHNDLGIALDLMGRTEEASKSYLRALRRRLRHKRYGDARAILANLVENALQRGRLPMAERWARRFRRYTVLFGNPAREPAGFFYHWYVRMLRGRPSVPPDAVFDAYPAGSIPVMVADAWIRHGLRKPAGRLAERNANGVRARDVTAWSLLRKAQAEGTPGPPVEEVRASGNRLLLAETLILHGCYEEALSVAEQHGFGLVEIEALRALGRERQDEGLGDEATRMAEDPRIDYAWGQRLDKPPPPFPQVSRGPCSGYWPQTLDIPEWPVPKEPLPILVTIPYADRMRPFVLPVRPDFAEVNHHTLFATIQWEAGYCQQHPEDIDHRYHLNVALAMAYMSILSGHLTEGLLLYIEPLLSANLSLVGNPCQRHAATLAGLLEVSDGDPRLMAVGWYNLGSYLEFTGDSELAMACFARSPLAEWYPAGPPLSCALDPESLARLISQWSRLRGEDYPESLEVMVPDGLPEVPTCGDPAVYRVLRNRARFLVGCRRHRQFYDSTLGWLKRRAAWPATRVPEWRDQLPLEIVPRPGHLPSIILNR
jgi:tetratricopeptide (TPR) repeat protein